MESKEHIIALIVMKHLGQSPRAIRPIPVGMTNNVYDVLLDGISIIVRLSEQTNYIKGSHVHIPLFKQLGIPVPNIIVEDYSKTTIPLAFQIQTKIPGQDIGAVIHTLRETELRLLGKTIADLFDKISTIKLQDNKFGVFWGEEHELSDTWTERITIWIDDIIERGQKTKVITSKIITILKNISLHYRSYFDSVKPTTYFGDLSSKNLMVLHGKFTGLVDIDGLTQGDYLEAIGRIKACYYGTSYGSIYLESIYDAMHLTIAQKEMVTVYALINQISVMCENGIQYNQNTNPNVDRSKEQQDKKVVAALAEEITQKW